MNLRLFMLLTLVASVTIGCFLLTFTGALIYEYRDMPGKLVQEARGQLSGGASGTPSKSKAKKTPQPVIVKNPYSADPAEMP
ncbi:MAG: hypothetical protein JNM18_16370 [Planctomycetaceae bacterium]|nr:hypothetical protein [Planctomycetaceae bacterium]